MTCQTQIQSLNDRWSVAEGVTGWAARFFRALRARRALRNMLSYDDRMLDDIGVTRDEIDRALGLPLDVNAAQALASEASRRREAEFWR